MTQAWVVLSGLSDHIRTINLCILPSQLVPQLPTFALKRVASLPLLMRRLRDPDMSVNAKLPRILKPIAWLSRSWIGTLNTLPRPGEARLDAEGEEQRIQEEEAVQYVRSY